MVAATAPRVSAGANNALAAAAASKPDIEWPVPVVNSLTGALETLGCQIERLIALFDTALGEANEIAVNLPTDGSGFHPSYATRAYDNWLMLEIAGGELRQVDRVVQALVDKALADRSAAA